MLSYQPANFIYHFSLEVKTLSYPLEHLFSFRVMSMESDLTLLIPVSGFRFSDVMENSREFQS